MDNYIKVVSDFNISLSFMFIIIRKKMSKVIENLKYKIKNFDLRTLPLTQQLMHFS
jgi:hypothetical protein